MKSSNQRQPNRKVDGVAQRQRRRNLGDFNDVKQISSDRFNLSRKAENNKQATANPLFNEASSLDQGVELIREEDVIENTRSDIDKSKIGSSNWRARRKAKKLAKKQKLAKRHAAYRYTRHTLRFAGVAVLLIGVYLGISSWSAISSIIDRGGEGALALQDNIQPSQLKGEGDGRINILLIGIGGDTHVAGDLADSIMIASIDPFANEMAMLSIPRDMYVEIPGYYSNRINAAHALGEEYEADNGGGIALLQKTIENNLDINIHYYVRVDFQGFVEAIDTVGGITVNLEEPVYDPNFDWQFGTDALNLPAGDVTLDGQTALLLARARGASGIGFGISRGDFGRSDQQRKILLALKNKVLSLGTFANPVRISSLLQSAGDHGRTNLQIGEMLTLYDILAKIPDDKIISYGLDTNPDNYLTSTSIDGASVLVPKSGDYTEIQIFLRELFVDGFIRSERPVIDVYNGTVVNGLAGDTATELETYGYTIGAVDNALTQDYQQTIAYDLTNGEKKYTKSLLESRFEVSMQSGSKLPAEYSNTESDFVIIIGDTYVQQETSY